MNPIKTPIDPATVANVSAGIPRPGVVQRMVQAAVRFALPQEIVNTWQGPGQVLVPVAQEEQGRGWDFPSQANTTATPRSGEMVSFATLRALADNYDLVRIVIERRKDQLERLKFKFVTEATDDKDKEDARVKQLTAFFAKPDRVNNWGAWLRMVVEDILVIDAPTLYPRKTFGNQLYSLEVMDGATIKVIIDNAGRRPIPPLPAYQQYIKGSPMAMYTADELVYSPRNPRSNKFYGFSPVEHIMMTVNIALRRQMHQLNYYTEGNIPEAFIPVPEGWTGKQIKEFQVIWDSMMSSDLAEKRKAKFIPNVKNVIFTREATLKDQMDEWLARVVCFCFAYPPSALTAQVNRATADDAREAAQDEGLVPLMQSVRNMVNDVIAQYFGWTDITFEWDIDKVLDPSTQADILTKYVDGDILTIDEAREDMGRSPLGIPGQTDVIKSMREATPKEQADAAREEQRLLTADVGDEKGAGPGKAGSGGKPAAQAAVGSAPSMKKAAGFVTQEQDDRQDRPLLTASANEMARVIHAAFKEASNAVAKSYAENFGKAARNKNVDKLIIEFVDGLLIELAGAQATVRKTINAVATDGARHALGQVDVETDAEITLANSKAASYATKRAAELVGKSGDGGQLAEATRTMLRASVASAAEVGMTAEDFAKQLQASYAFSEKRALAIARTELRAADVAGNMAGYEASGVVMGKRWLLANDERTCPVCEGNAEQGTVGLRKEFQSGDQGPPAHPNCRCDIAPVID